MATFPRPPWTRVNALTYLGQASLRGSRDNALASLAEIHRARQPDPMLTTALLPAPPPRSPLARGEHPLRREQQLR